MKLISLLVQHLFYIHGYFPAIIRSDLRTMLCHYSKSNGYHMINFTFRIISDFFRKQIARRKWILSAREQKTLTTAFDSLQFLRATCGTGSPPRNTSAEKK